MLALALTFAVGCSSDEQAEGAMTEDAAGLISQPYDVAIVHANRANSTGDLSQVNGIIREVVANEGYLVAVLADGKPQAITGTFTLQESNSRRREAEIQSNLDDVAKIDWSATAPEVDLFNAIRLANNQLGVGGRSDVDNLLIVIDSGISTAGPINFTDDDTRYGLLDPQHLTEQLIDNGDLVEFENIDKVLWFGLGEACDPQESPNDGVKQLMENMYRAVFEAGGVVLPENNGEIFRPGNNTLPSGDLPEVTVVEMPRVSSHEDGSLVKLGDKLEFDENSSSLKFDYDSSQFADAGAANAELEQYTNQLVDFPDLHVTIKGYTDVNGDENYNLGLSEKRANAVRDMMVAGGVAPDQITVVGMGESADYETDEENRRVEIVFGE